MCTRCCNVDVLMASAVVLPALKVHAMSGPPPPAVLAVVRRQQAAWLVARFGPFKELGGAVLQRPAGGVQRSGRGERVQHPLFAMKLTEP